jgi:hypothetical protein
MKFDIKIKYSIDLDKCNEKVLSSQNPIEKKFKKYQFNFIDGDKMFLFSETDLIIEEIKKNKDLEFSTDVVNYGEKDEEVYNFLNDRYSMHLFLLSKWDKYYQFFDWTCCNRIRATNEEHFKYLKSFLKNFQNEFISYTKKNYYIELNNNGLTVYSDDVNTIKDLEKCLQIDEKSIASKLDPGIFTDLTQDAEQVTSQMF